MLQAKAAAQRCGDVISWELQRANLRRRFARCQKFPHERSSFSLGNDILPMKRRLLFSTFACLILFNVLLGVRFYTAHAAGTDDDSGYSQISVFAKAVQLLRQDYVDGSKTSYPVARRRISSTRLRHSRRENLRRGRNSLRRISRGTGAAA